MKYKNLRPAIAMIELIFALVIMGIALMSAPMLISTASQSVTVALQQEGINEASSRIAMILTYPWDENDINDSCIPPVLHVTHGHIALEEHNQSHRIGVPLYSSSHTFKCGKSEFNASSTIGAEANDAYNDDIDDFTNTSLTLDNSGSGGKDYIEKDTVSIATSVLYNDDNTTSGNYDADTITFNPFSTTATGTTNIKQIKVTLTSTNSAQELEKTINLNAFSCNIGGYDYERRVMP